MKNQLVVFLIAAFLGLSLSSNAGTVKFETIVLKDSVKTASFKVYGNCGMCKGRIEKAAKIKGVKSAEWNKGTKVLTVEYDAVKVSEEAIHKAIADAGHDTENMAASDESYNNLMGCCQYKRK